MNRVFCICVALFWYTFLPISSVEARCFLDRLIINVMALDNTDYLTSYDIEPSILTLYQANIKKHVMPYCDIGDISMHVNDRNGYAIRNGNSNILTITLHVSVGNRAIGGYCTVSSMINGLDRDSTQRSLLVTDLEFQQSISYAFSLCAEITEQISSRLKSK
ncbi:MAG: hypothetical protein U1E17_12760 [Geminicoccaceae bacterium]